MIHTRTHIHIYIIIISGMGNAQTRGKLSDKKQDARSEKTRFITRIIIDVLLSFCVFLLYTA